jgi:tetratricopeptide (TPR) repeat protein
MQLGVELEKNAHLTLNTNSLYDYAEQLFGVEYAKQEKCAELFKIAGNTYTLEKKYEDSVRCYDIAIEIYNKTQKMNYDIEIKDLLIRILKNGLYYMNYESIIKYKYMLAERNGIAGKYNKYVSECVEISYIYIENKIYDKALEILANCPDDDKYVMESKGIIYVKSENYNEASNIYYEMATNLNSKKLSQYAQNNKLMTSVLCKMVLHNITNIISFINDICGKFYNFRISQECNFIDALINGITKNDEKKFDDVVCQIISRKMLSDEIIELFNKIKKNLIMNVIDESFNTEEELDLC